MNENVLRGGRPASGAPASESTELTPVTGTKAPLTRPPPVNIVTKPAVVPPDAPPPGWRPPDDRAEAAEVSRLVWEKVAPRLPPGTGVVYVSPDYALTRVPFAALPRLQ